MTTAVAEPTQQQARARRRIRLKWALVAVATVLLTAFIVLANVWAAYQPLRAGSIYGGGDGELGADNPLHPPATMIQGTKGHVTQLVISLRNDGRFAVTVDRISFAEGWLRVVSAAWADRADGAPVHFPDRIAAHDEHAYVFTVRVWACLNPRVAPSFKKVHFFSHARGDAPPAWIPTPGGGVIKGGTPPCPDPGG